MWLICFQNVHIHIAYFFLFEGGFAVNIPMHICRKKLYPPQRNFLCSKSSNSFHTFHVRPPQHSGPENLKKSKPKNSWNQINQFFSREIAFLADLNFFPVQKLIFGHFWICKKWNLVKKIIREIDWFDFTSFLAWTFLNFLAHCGCDPLWKVIENSPYNREKGMKKLLLKLIYLISRVFLAWTFLNFLARCVIHGTSETRVSGTLSSVTK